jgi:glycosyltransferase involved in cell wall biosynthesis
MKIGLVIYGSLDTLSGGYLYDRKLIEYLRAQGDTVEVISLPPGMADRSDWRNYMAHLGDNLTFRLPAGLDILIQDELNHPSLIAANHAPHPPALASGYPVISMVHHLRCSEQRPAWQNAFYRFVERRYLRSVDGFIFNSKTTQGVVRAMVDTNKPSLVAYPPTDRFGGGLSDSPAGGIDLVQSRASEIPPLRLLFLGNVISRKGLHTILNALALLQTSFKDTREPPYFILDVIGSLTADPSYAHEMQQFALSHALSPVTSSAQPAIVHFHGALDTDLLVQMLRTAHVLVVPSSYEGFGIVYLEGMAFGLPAIGTTSGAASEIIASSETGFLIQPNDAQALASHLAALLADRNLLAKMSLNALKRYQQQPRWTETAERIREFLQTQLK